ncbi:Bifunctional enzyme IspD/IspF [bioreactor metagenome]|uniref:Bifunctional enzyme IspD/IspF n=1 Tax=bioreactor metagenome TaxID=1076179 RepID=A0A644TMS8_9ZZZZ|nr:2-C-methyl-D-erythritol 4-phosphate cytidylyltransferase [Negativicutes bacterium]
MVTAIIAAAGQGKRMGRGINKVFIPLSHCPVLVHTVRKFSHCEIVDNLIIVTGPDEVGEVKALLAGLKNIKPWQVIAGGSERQYSICNALAAVDDQTEITIVHDGARPLVDVETIEKVVATARQYRAAGVAVPVKDTIKTVDAEGFIIDTPPRDTLWAIQTPQAFNTSLLRQAYTSAAQEGYLGTDDASLVERLGVKVKIVSGSYNNLKITTPEDLLLAEAILQQGCGSNMVRAGIGYDVHRLVERRKLILGGVEVPYSLGLEGHSDADVLLHAIKDALLGAAALGDIGRHFPDTDDRYKGVSSLLLLVKVQEIVANQGYRVNNIDATIVAQRPKLADYIPQMAKNIAKALDVSEKQVNVKATTTEGLGFAGQGEGIAAYAVATIMKTSSDKVRLDSDGVLTPPES